MISNPVLYRVFSRDVTTAVLVSLNKGATAMLVSPINPPRIELYCLCKRFLLFWWKNMLTDHVGENTLCRDRSLSHGVALLLFWYVKEWKQCILDVVITLSVCIGAFGIESTTTEHGA